MTLFVNVSLVSEQSVIKLKEKKKIFCCYDNFYISTFAFILDWDKTYYSLAQTNQKFNSASFFFLLKIFLTVNSDLLKLHFPMEMS